MTRIFDRTGEIEQYQDFLKYYFILKYRLRMGKKSILLKLKKLNKDTYCDIFVSPPVTE
jgi:hypothetical protein